MKPVIILTACVKAHGTTKDTHEERLYIYKKNIRLWLEHTLLPIIVVDSSGEQFDDIKHDRLTVISIKIANLDCSSSIYEALSLMNVLSSNVSEQYDFFVKVTCRYFLPQLEYHINNLNEDVSIMYQTLHGSNYQHSEMFGFTRSLFSHIFKSVVFENKIMEHAIFKLDEKVQCKSVRLPLLHIHEKVKRGGDGMILPYL
jgi:hypothetical protein